jgi:hypothetical protein
MITGENTEANIFMYGMRKEKNEVRSFKTEKAE